MSAWSKTLQQTGLCVLLVLLTQGAALTASTEGITNQPFCGAINDRATIQVLFSVNQGQHVSQSWVTLAGLSSNPDRSTSTLALVYEIDSTFIGKARLLLVGDALSTNLVDDTVRFADGEGRYMVLANLERPFDDNKVYKMVFSYDCRVGELSVSIMDVEATKQIYAGYLPVHTTQEQLFAALGSVRVVKGPGNDLSVTRQITDWLPGVYTRLGMPVVLGKLQWHLTVRSSGQPTREAYSYRFGEGEEVGIYVQWPKAPVTGHLVLMLEDTHANDALTDETELHEIIRLPWSEIPQSMSLDNLLPSGRYEITMFYDDGLTHYMLGKELVEIVRGIKSYELNVAKEILGSTPVAGSLRIVADRVIQNVDVEVVGTRVVKTPSIASPTQVTLLKARLPELQPGENTVPFTITPSEIGGPGDLLVHTAIWGIPQESQQKITLQSGWSQDGLELVSLQQEAIQRIGWIAETPPGLDFMLTNKQNQPVAGSIRAALIRPDAKLGRDVEVWLPVSATAFQLAPGGSVTFSLGSISKAAVGWHSLQIVINLENGATTTIPIGSYYLGLPACTNKDLQIKDGSLHIGGKPTFLRGIGFYDFTLRSPAEWERDLRRYADWGMNLIEVFVLPGAGPTFGQFLDAAQKAGVYVTGDIHWKQIWELDWSARYRALIPYLTHWDHPNLVAWVLRDDSMYVWHYPELLKMRDFIRQYDSKTLITTTMFDSRYYLDPPHDLYGLTPAQWANYKVLLNFPTPYEYPVLRRAGGAFAPMPGTRGGLDVVQVLAERTRSAWNDPNLYMWTWVQAHSQRVTISKLKFEYNESYTSTPDQLRLLTYEMITAGIRGLLYYRDYFFEDLHFGMGRRHELKLMWNTLDKVEPFLAQGQRSTLLPREVEGVEAVQFSLNAEKVVLLVQHHFADVRHVGTGMNGPLQLSIPINDVSSKAYLLSPLGVTELHTTMQDGVLQVNVPAFDLTAVLLITSNTEHIQELTAAFTDQLGEAARSALFVLADTLAKVEAVCQLIPALPSTESTLEQSRAAYKSALAHYAAGDWAQAYSESDVAREPLRQLGGAQLEAAAQSNPIGLNQQIESYFSLPQFYGFTSQLSQVVGEKLTQALVPLGGPEWPDVRAWHE